MEAAPLSYGSWADHSRMQARIRRTDSARSRHDEKRSKRSKPDRDALYLVTDLAGFYERCGWRFLGIVRGDDGCLVRMYASNPEF